MERTTERAGLGIRCSVYGRLRIPLMSQVSGSDSSRVRLFPSMARRPAGAFYPGIEDWIHLLSSASLLFMRKRSTVFLITIPYLLNNF